MQDEKIITKKRGRPKGSKNKVRTKKSPTKKVPAKTNSTSETQTVSKTKKSHLSPYHRTIRYTTIGLAMLMLFVTGIAGGLALNLSAFNTIASDINRLSDSQLRDAINARPKLSAELVQSIRDAYQRSIPVNIPEVSPSETPPHNELEIDTIN